MKVALRLAVLVVLGVATWSFVEAQDKRNPRLPTLAPPKPALQIRGVPTTAQLPKPTGGESSLPAVTSGPLTSKPAATRDVAIPTAQTPRPEPHLPASHLPVVAPGSEESKSNVHLSLGTLSPTPEMWFYEQMRQDYNNAELQVRRHAEEEGAQRRARIASRAWYGVSASRPTAHVTPFTYHYSPSWIASSRPSYRPAVPAAPVVVEHRRPYVGLSGFGSW